MAIILAMALAAMAGGPAAGERVVERTRVATSDLDLGRERDRRRLRRRVDAAVRAVCPDEGFAAIAERLSLYDCRAAAAAEAMAAVDRRIAAARPAPVVAAR